MSVKCCKCDNIFWTDMSHSQCNFESSSERSFKSVQNYFLTDKYIDTKLVKCYAHYIPNAMLTDEMTILILEFCECDMCLSNVCSHHIHHCHIQSFLLWILITIIVYKGRIKVLTFKSALFLSYRYASHSANCLIRYKIYEIVNMTLDRHVGQTRLTNTKSGTQYRGITH